MTRDGTGVAEQNDLLSKLLSLASASTDNSLLQISDKVPAGRGLIFTCNIDAKQVLLTLPADALINVKSFKGFFHTELLPNAVSVTRGGANRSDDGRWSSAQLLSLLLARAQVEVEMGAKRREGATTKQHELLRLFVQTLPRRFDTVPLTWSFFAGRLSNGADEASGTWKEPFFQHLLDALPPHSKHLSQQVLRRFTADWSLFCTLRTSHPDTLAEPPLLSSSPTLARSILTAIDEDIYLWAWLCVNSRCVFLPLGLANHGDNFTLAPMLDMANHTSDATRECKVRYQAGGLEMYAPEEAAGEGGECCITYGAHSNESLLSEYGFVLPADVSAKSQGKSDGERWKGSRYVDVLVDDDIERLLKSQGTEGEGKIELLQNRGYWGEFTLHPYPEPAHPSHRLIPALRLAAMDMRTSRPAEKVSKVRAVSGVKAGKNHTQHELSEVERWEETLTGYREIVTEENEREAHLLLAELCKSRRKDGEAARRRWEEAKALLESRTEDNGRGRRLEPDVDGCKTSLAFVGQLLEEEEAVLRLVERNATGLVEW